MNRRIQQLWKERKREVVLIGAVFLLIFISLLVNMGSIRKKASRNLRGIGNYQKVLKEKQAELQEAIQLEHKMSIPIWQIKAQQQDFWIMKINTQTEFRRKIEQAARNSNLRLKSFGTMQNMKIANDLNGYEVSIAADGQFNELTDFMSRIKQEKPTIFWKNITITPDNIRSPNFLMLNATLKIVVLSSPDIEQRLWGN